MCMIRGFCAYMRARRSPLGLASLVGVPLSTLVWKAFVKQSNLGANSSTQAFDTARLNQAKPKFPPRAKKLHHRSDQTPRKAVVYFEHVLYPFHSLTRWPRLDPGLNPTTTIVHHQSCVQLSVGVVPQLESASLGDKTTSHVQLLCTRFIDCDCRAVEKKRSLNGSGGWVMRYTSGVQHPPQTLPTSHASTHTSTRFSC